MTNTHSLAGTGPDGHIDALRTPPLTESQNPSAAQVREAFFDAPHSYLDIGHSRLAYRRFGHGPDVLFVHGWPVSSATFRAQLPALARDYTCHLIDLPGAGQSQADRDAPISLQGHVESFARAVDQLGLSSYALVSHDSGGLVARMHAADNPRVTALILSGSEIPGHRPALLQSMVALLRLPGGGRLLTLLMALKVVRHSILAFGGCFEDVRHAEGDFHRLYVEPLLKDRRYASQGLELARTLDFDFIDTLAGVHGRIHAPALLLWGERDPYFPAEKARAMAAQFAGPTRFEVVPGTRLFAHEERPEVFAARTAAFLAEQGVAKRPRSV